MEVPASPPFDKLRLQAGEHLVWCDSNPTFHRGISYGIAISDQAAYLFSPFWVWFARWRRYPLHQIRSAAFIDSHWSPRLVLQLANGKAILRTPLDHKSEMSFDRDILKQAASLIEKRRCGA